MNIYLEILLRTVICAVALFILARIGGQRLITQMTFYDFVTVITVGSIAGALCIDDSINIWGAVMSMAVFILLSLVIGMLTTKSIWARRILTGTPIMLVSKGKILEKGLLRSHFDVNDLLRELRTLGYFNIADVNHVILETNGKLSVLPKAAVRPVNTADLNIQAKENGLLADVIIDGVVMKRNLNAMNYDENWLREQLKMQKIDNIREVFLATLDEENNLSVYLKNHNKQKGTIFQ